MRFAYLAVLVGVCSTAALAEIRSVGREIILGAQAQSCILEFKSPKMKMKNFSSFCSGTLVYKNKILTAAHCVAGIKADIVAKDPAAEVRARCNPSATTNLDGSNTVTFGETLALSTTNMWFHPQYNARTLVNDIGMYESTVASKIPPVEIAKPSDVVDLATGKFDLTKYECKISGFGRNATGGSGVPFSIDLKNNTFVPLARAAVDKGESLVIEQSLMVETKQMTFEDMRYTSFVLGMFYEQLTSGTGDAIPNMISTFNDFGLIKWSVMPGDSGGGTQCKSLTGGKDVVIAVNSAIAPSNAQVFYKDFMSKDSAEFKYTNMFSPVTITLDVNGNPVVPTP